MGATSPVTSPELPGGDGHGWAGVGPTSPLHFFRIEVPKSCGAVTARGFATGHCELEATGTADTGPQLALG